MATDKARFSYLDGLRGWAALCVVVFHAGRETFGQILPVIRTNLLGPLNNGRFAVALFFALSGFVLARRYIATKDQAGLQRLAAGRYVRLVIPVGCISFIGYLIAIGNFGLPQAAGAIVRSPWFSESMVFPKPPDFISFLKFCFFDVFTNVPDLMPYNQFTWTMMYELFGSFMLFATLSLSSGGTMLRRASLALMFCITYSIDPLYSLFFGGALLAEIDVAWTRVVPAMARNSAALVLLTVVWITSSGAYGYDQTAQALALLVCVLISPLVQWVLETPVSQWLGRISFPLYLVHGYVLFGAGAWAIIELERLGFPIPQIAAIVTPAVIAASLLAAWALTPIEHLAKTVAHWAGRVLTRETRHVGLISAR